MNAFSLILLYSSIFALVASSPALEQIKNLVGSGWKKVPAENRAGHLQIQMNELDERNGQVHTAKTKAKFHMDNGNAKSAEFHEKTALQRQKSVTRITKNIGVLQDFGHVKMKTLKGNRPVLKPKEK
ncbi:uncharacterized protein FA14DRAFT_182150 [Meira miltonrushii]|uniref:Uncharacterized protein n=1 Tax=Meira miltonrushii TaxID=1280837 RepID=A0A316V3Z1_9BASI|nr:uncharacterized protein FA14DRAFT_182150 [Meira miltonrushii]PWN32240.1 hypothetical protein FA14DRAFT_182150 [Meira miltonrushii]